MSKIDMLTIQGFRSIRSLDKLQLNNLNVLIGANGVGKSNFVSYFRMLHELVEGRLQIWTSKQGGADRVLSFGIKETSCFSSTLFLDVMVTTLPWNQQQMKVLHLFLRKFISKGIVLLPLQNSVLVTWNHC